MDLQSDTLTLKQVRGQGRAFVVVYEAGHYQNFIESLETAFQKEGRLFEIESCIVTTTNWKRLGEALAALLLNEGIRQASFIGFGGAASLIFNHFLYEPKSVRTIILVDPTTRPHPTYFDRVVDKIERKLPLGLPLRQNISGFDAKLFLQRVRCPLLLVTTSNASAFVRSECEVMENALPTAWRVDLVASENRGASGSETEVATLASLTQQFQDIPAKCPQKNRMNSEVTSVNS